MNLSQGPTPKGLPGLLWAFCAGLLFDLRVRRRMLFGTVLASVLMVFVGSAVLGKTLESRPLWFALWWLACMGLTFFTILLALYDLLLVRKAAVIHRRALRAVLAARPPAKTGDKKP